MRLLCERLGVAEYWVVNVETATDECTRRYQPVDLEHL